MRSVYREAALGASLKAALEGLVREEHLTPNLIEETMKSYDDQLLKIDLTRDWSATANRSRPQWLHGSIEKGQLSEYNIVDGVVTFKLLQADFRGSAFAGATLTVKNVKMVLADAKQIESGAVAALPAPPAAAGSSGTAPAAAPEAAAQLEMDGDSDDEAAVPQGDGAHADDAAAAKRPRLVEPPARRVPQADGPGDGGAVVLWASKA